MCGLYILGKEKETMASSNYPDELPSDVEPEVTPDDWENNMQGDYCITIPETIEVTIDENIKDLLTIDVGEYDINTDWIAQTDHTYSGDLIIDNQTDDPITVAQTIREQRLQIEVLSEMIEEMVRRKDFNIEWDLEKRVEQKKFLRKLSK